MNSSFFNFIVKKCNAVLVKLHCNQYILANYLLHVSSPHPTKFGKFHNLYFGTYSTLFFSLLKSLAVAISYPVYKIFDKPLSKRILSAGIKDTLVISHLIKKESLKNRVDFYFGELLSGKNKKEYKILECLINHTNDTISINDDCHQLSTNTVILPKRTSILYEYRILFIQLFNTIKWFCFSFYKKNNRRFSQTIATGFLSQESINALRISKQIEILITKYKFKKIIITWEGLAWERLLMHTVQKKFPDIQCVGFQHSVLLPSVNSMLVNIPYANPHKLITTNIYNYRFLKSHLGYNTLMDVSGMPRIDFSKRPQSDTKPVKEYLKILVTPEGLKDECIKLFDFVIRLANENPPIHFVFRLHPIYPYHEFVKDYPLYANLPKNCVVSANSQMEEDLKDADFLFYRGSTTCMSALLNFVYPVYVKMEEDVLSINPLFLYKETYLEIENGNDFTEKILHFFYSTNARKNYDNYLSKHVIDHFQTYDFKVFLN